MAVQSTTLVKLLLDCVDRCGDKPALILPAAGEAQPVKMTWNDLALEARRLAAGLRRAGIQPGDRVAQVSENRYEWVLADLAAQFARGVHVALHSSLSGQQIAWQIENGSSAIQVPDLPRSFVHAVTRTNEPAATASLLRELATIFRAARNRRLHWVLALLEPLAIVVVGVIVGLVFFATFLPLFTIICAVFYGMAVQDCDKLLHNADERR